MYILAFVAFVAVLLWLFGTKVISLERVETPEPVKKNDLQLQNYVPAPAADYCVDLWKLYDFSLKIKGNRKTKLGDFRVDASGKNCTISVNGTLNQHAFLVTYLHEVAHLCAWRLYGRRIKPHGPEWQQQFRLLMQPLLNTEVFPADILKPLRKYMLAPAASTASCQPLWIALRMFDEQPFANAHYLGQLAIGDKFRFSENTYQKVEMRRTRALCQNLSNGRRYLISTAAQVELVA